METVRIKATPEMGDIVIYHVGESDQEELKHNHAHELPAVVVQVWSDTCVNLKVFTDGPTDVWVTSAMRGRGPSQWEYRYQAVG